MKDVEEALRAHSAWSDRNATPEPRNPPNPRNSLALDDSVTR